MVKKFASVFVCAFLLFNIAIIRSTSDESIGIKTNADSVLDTTDESIEIKTNTDSVIVSTDESYEVLQHIQRIFYNFIESLKASQKENLPSEHVEYAGVVYLTFDDGPVSTITPQILDVLKKYNVKATFFNIGQYVDKNPQLAKRVYDEGHTVANHSYTHKKAMFSSFETFKQEITNTMVAIKNATGEYPKYFRVPYGTKINETYKKYLASKGLTIVSWNCESYDSRKDVKTTEAILNGIKSTMKNRKEVTVIMHDTYGKQHTVDALPSIIEYFQSINYQFKRYGE